MTEDRSPQGPEDLDAIPEKQLHILLHTLGIPTSGRPKKPYRNHYVTGPGHHSLDALRKLEAAGLMTTSERGRSLCAAGSIVWTTTPEGRAAAVAWQERRYARVSRGKKRYLHWLDGDGWGVTFGEYLRRGWYKEAGL